MISAVLESPVPLALAGAASLAAFLVRHKPPHSRLGGLGLANAITLLRLGLVVAAALAAPTWWAFGLVLVLDGLDGAVARRLDESTDFGAHFDMETDALFVGVLCVASFVAGAPAWVLLFGALRYALVLTRLFFPVEVPRERRSQFGRFVFGGAVCALLLSLTEAPLPLRMAALAVALVALLASFSQDFAALRRTA
ncbi:MAG TPA: CDP-alcohol phosphatidyltransferase family protein [Archangium sp.]